MGKWGKRAKIAKIISVPKRILKCFFPEWKHFQAKTSKMADAGSEFHVWLCSRLKSLNLDEEVLGEYLSGILDGDDSTHEEKREALTETLEGMMV